MGITPTQSSPRTISPTAIVTTFTYGIGYVNNLTKGILTKDMSVISLTAPHRERHFVGPSDETDSRAAKKKSTIISNHRCLVSYVRVQQTLIDRTILIADVYVLQIVFYMPHGFEFVDKCTYPAKSAVFRKRHSDEVHGGFFPCQILGTITRFAYKHS